MKSKGGRLLIVLILVLLMIGVNYFFDKPQVRLEGREEAERFRLYANPSFEKWSGFEFTFLKAFYYTLGLRVYMGKLSEEYLAPPPFAKDPIVRTAEVVTRLCPYYYDIYYIANGYLTWDYGDVETANRLLEKGLEYTPERWIYYLYLGFNHFYFLKDYEKGAMYLVEASEVSGKPQYAHLASKLLYASGRTEVAIGILKGMIENTRDEGWKRGLETRLKALEGIYELEKAVEVFRERFGTLPQNLEELKNAGIIKGIPEDPYGGEFYIDEEGNVRTTSNLTYMD